MSADDTRSLVLIVEDEPKLALLLEDYLHAAGYRTHTVSDGLSVVAEVRSSQPTLILMDLMLPGRDGVSICRELRSFTQVPIVIVTARVEEIDRLLGLEAGADDYICKPFSPREVLARIKAILRRVSNAAAPPSRRLVIEPGSFRATLNGQALELTPIEFRLLSAFAAAPGRVFSRQQLLDSAYTHDRVVTDRTIDSHIKNLRRKLSQAHAEQELIESIYGIGYRFEAP